MVMSSDTKSDSARVAVGDEVFLKINVRNELNYRLGPKFEGPFRVIEEERGV